MTPLIGARHVGATLVLALAGVSLGIPAASAVPIGAEDSASIQVIGGDEVPNQADNPGAVLLTVGGKQWCSAVRIGPTWVMTARHCYEHPFKDGITFEFDGVYTDSVRAMEGPKATVKKVHVAPTADMVLLELNESTPGPIAQWDDQRIPDRARTSYYGWGYTSPWGGFQLSPILKKGEALVRGYTRGSYHGGSNISLNGINSCIAGGDSGGPMFLNGRLIATASWSMVGGGTRFCYMGYVPLDQNADWIRKTTGIAPRSTVYS